MATQDPTVRKAYRQGELLFVPLDAEDMAQLHLNLREQSYPRWNELKTNVLREGEATGHRHEVLTDAPGVATILAPAGGLMPALPDMDSIAREDRLLAAREPFQVVHPEHRPLKLPGGLFLVIVQREYDEVRARRIRD